MPPTEDTIKAKAEELRCLLALHQAAVGAQAAKPLGVALLPVARTIEDIHQGVPQNRFARPVPAPVRAAARQGKPLTPRMRTIARLIAEGRSNKEMADLLNLSVKTIESHRMLMMERLGLHDIASVVRYALRAGLMAEEACVAAG